MMENREYLINLFDIYKDLLTSIEKETFSNYYEEDLSLSEIADNRSITKSSVGKTLNNALNKLQEYESILKIYKNKMQIKELLNENNIDIIKTKLGKIIE